MSSISIGKELDDALVAAGLISITESLAVGFSDAMHDHAGIVDIATLFTWSEQQRRETLSMIARHELGVDKMDEDLYDFVLGRNAQATAIHVNLRKILNDKHS